ncbi:hypothetical protein ScPMuIL_018155 [Solemya velum]
MILWPIIQIMTCSVFPYALATVSRPQPIPPSMYRRAERKTNQTIDQIIYGVMGGTKVPSNLGEHRLPGGTVLAELDMMLTKDQLHRLYDNQTNNISKRKATRSANLRWTNNEIVYKFANNHFSVKEIYHLKRAMTEWERYTCLRFRKAKNTDTNYIRIQNGQGCNSQLGMVGGVQALNLETPGCRFKGLYIHEIGHAIGLVHEHQLPNRDEYIQILLNNVDPAMRIWFNKYSRSQVDQFDVLYEYSSVMHYGITAFSRDGTSQTIRAKQGDLEHTIGKVYQKELSFSDTKIVNRMYGCGGSCPETIKCSAGGFVDENCLCICKDGTHDCQTNGPRSDASCVNAHYDSWQCYIWAQQGECGRNPDFMESKCGKSCGVCQNIHDSKPGQCVDVYPEPKCEKWAEYGDCLTNEDWMSVNCRKTCRACSSSDNSHMNCDNDHDDKECDEWARDGECHMNIDWMFDNCKKSCKMCDKTEKPTNDGRDENEDGVCINNHDDSQCEYWANDNECNKNPSWMKVNCKKACGVCTRGGECVDLYDTSQCTNWAERNECVNNPDWMTANCRKSCNACVKSEICRNDHDDNACDNWASRGECEKNPDWMLKKCKKSCEVCMSKTKDTGSSGSIGVLSSTISILVSALLLSVLFV